MPTVRATREHSQVTTKNRHRYQFTPKHHGGPGSKGQAQWLEAISFEEEFSVFEAADNFAIVDAK